MPSFKKTQNSFSMGEVSPDFYPRVQPNAVAKLENIHATVAGVLARRPGSVKIGDVRDADSVIIPFGNEFVLIMSAARMYIYRNEALFQAFLMEWDRPVDDVRQVQWVQRFDTMIFTHPSNPPKILQRSGQGFSFSEFQFERDGRSFPIMPFMRFADTEGATLTVTAHSNGTNWARVVASKPIWQPSNETGFLTFMDRKWEVITYVSPTELVAVTSNTFTPPAAPIGDWYESAFSERRGYPRAITFHQDRLVFGGSRDYPSGLWMSKTGRHHNFDTGTGLDDEAIFITLLSETEQKICACISSRDLLILTDSGEWAISSAPLTPSTINIRQHTGIGTEPSRFAQPQKINSATVFISKTGIREMALDELGENYASTDLTLMARHLVDKPIALAYSAALSQLFALMSDGTMAVLTKQSETATSAWCLYKTQGRYKYVAASRDAVYTIVERDGKCQLEKFSPGAASDAGYGFSWIAAGAPITVDRHIPRKIRIIRASAAVQGASHIKINSFDFYRDRDFSGVISANILGSMTDPTASPWTVQSDEQADAKILSITVEGTYEL